MKILLVEDDMNLGFVIQDNLKMNGYKVHLAKNGKSGLQAFNQKNFDLCILDIMLPLKDGFSLAQDIRKVDQKIPIIFLTAKTMNEDKIKGFLSGADDYITKPFVMDEFLLRIKAILKRTGLNSTKKSGYNIGKLHFDTKNFILKGANKEISLTKKEAEILKILCSKKGMVVERELILNMVWGDDNYFNGRSLDVFISKLRKYLYLDKNISLDNIHGIGFCLKEEN